MRTTEGRWRPFQVASLHHLRVVLCLLAESIASLTVALDRRVTRLNQPPYLASGLVASSFFTFFKRLVGLVFAGFFLAAIEFLLDFLRLPPGGIPSYRQMTGQFPGKQLHAQILPIEEDMNRRTRSKPGPERNSVESVNIP
jgi:hypothetical protein